MGAEVDNILDVWLNTIGSKNWDRTDVSTDMFLKANFEDLWARGRDGEFGSWICQPRSCLALLILLDQMPRRMHRGSELAYASDARALAVAKRAIVMGHDMRIDEPQRRFFYLPLMHSESLMDQERCVRLMALRLPHAREVELEHAKSYREVIRQYGRFPFRNTVLGRDSTPTEDMYLETGALVQSAALAG